jgi:hypothetical protein
MAHTMKECIKSRLNWTKASKKLGIKRGFCSDSKLSYLNGSPKLPSPLSQPNSYIQCLLN